ncbi:MAG: hypothetical protein EU532_11730, partial [Promethearchaeota archaeon]
MVDVRGSLRVAFSTIFAPHENFEPKDLKIDARMFPGFQEEKMIDLSKVNENSDRRVVKAVKKLKSKIGDKRLKLAEREGPFKIFLVKKGLSKRNVKELVAKTQIDNLGLILEIIETDPKALALKIEFKNQDELLECLKMARNSLDTLKNTIKDPQSVVKTAILMCFELFQVSKENVKIYSREDGELLYIDDLREFSISFKPNNEIEEMGYLDFVESEKKYGFEIDWVIYNVDNTRWINILQRVAVIATTTIMQYLVPRVSATVGSLIKNAIKHKTDELLVAGCNMDIRLIFHELLRANLAIEYIKFQRFEANIWSEEEKKTLLKEYGNKVMKSPEIVERGTD